MTYDNAVEYINNIPKFVKKNKPEHTLAFLDRLNNPHKNMKLIHVAGTNGKGSVCAFISGVLTEAGKKTGLFVSPHLTEITERISVNNVNVSKEEFTESFVTIKKIAGRMAQEGFASPSYFEFLFLMAMNIFAQNKVEYAVLETGLGGRLDATNVIEHPQVCVITSIGYDHTEILGDTIEKIAFEKAGIIKPGVPVVYQASDEAAARVIEKRAAWLGAPAYPVRVSDYKILKKSDDYIDFSPICGYYLNNVFRIPFVAEYQAENGMLAVNALSCLQDIREDVRAVKNGMAKVSWHGRMEQVMPGVFFDGAHNASGIDAFIVSALGCACRGKRMVLFSAVKEKDYEYMADKLCSCLKPDKVYVAGMNTKRGVPAHILGSKFASEGLFVSENVEDAFRKALTEKGEDDVLFCVGSLYLIGELRKILNL